MFFAPAGFVPARLVNSPDEVVFFTRALPLPIQVPGSSRRVIINHGWSG